LRAVFIPNAATWAHEHADLDAADTGILHLAAFAELTRHF
jgi:putative hydrolase of the HAD superfamily